MPLQSPLGGHDFPGLTSCFFSRFISRAHGHWPVPGVRGQRTITIRGWRRVAV